MTVEAVRRSVNAPRPLLLNSVISLLVFYIHSRGDESTANRAGIFDLCAGAAVGLYSMAAPFNPYSAEIFLYKPWRLKGFFNLKSL